MANNLQTCLERDDEAGDVMEKLLQYFQTECTNLDQLHNADLVQIPGLHYVSYIVFEGVPILPPVMTPLRRDEMLMYKRQAVLAETRLRARARQKLLQRVQNVMSEIEDQQQRVSSRQSTLKEPITMATVNTMVTNQVSNDNIMDPCRVIQSETLQHNIEGDQQSDRTNVTHNTHINESKVIEDNNLLTENMNNEKTKVTTHSIQNGNVKSTDVDVGIATQLPNVSYQTTENSSHDTIKLVDTIPSAPVYSSTDIHQDNVTSSSAPLDSGIFSHDITSLEPTDNTTVVNDGQSRIVIDTDNTTMVNDRNSRIVIENVDEGTIVDLTDISTDKETGSSVQSTPRDQTSQAITRHTDSGCHGTDQTSQAITRHTDHSCHGSDQTSHAMTQHTDSGCHGSDGDDESDSYNGNVNTMKHPSEMALGLQLLRNKLQEDKQQSATENMNTWPRESNRIPSNNTSQTLSDISVSKKRSSAAQWIQQSLAQIQPPPMTGSMERGVVSDIGVGSDKGGVGSDVTSSVTSGTTYSSEEMNNTVIDKDEGQLQVIKSIESEEQESDDRSEHVHTITQPTSDIQGHIDNTINIKDIQVSDQPDNRRLPLLSKVTFDTTPDGSPRKLPSNKPHQDVKDRFDAFPSEPSPETWVRKVTNENSGSEGSDKGDDKGSIGSPGPNKTPNLSNISFHDSDEEQISEQELCEPFMTSVATEDLVTKSTELAQYMTAANKSMETIQSSMSPILQGGDSTSQGASQVKTTPSSGPSSKERIRRNSYTLDHPSPALIAAAHAKDTSTKDIVFKSQPEITGSMEDLRIKPVQRKLHYEKERSSATVEYVAMGNHPDEMLPVVAIDDDLEERTGKQEHLQRYLQNLSEMPGMAVASEDEDLPSTVDTSRALYLQANHNYPVSGHSMPIPATYEPIIDQFTSNSLPQPINSDEDSMLQDQMITYYEEMERTLIQQQQQQLTALIAEQEKQQHLFRQQLIKRGQKMNQSRNSGEQDDHSQCQTWSKQLQQPPVIGQVQGHLQYQSLPIDGASYQQTLQPMASTLPLAMQPHVTMETADISMLPPSDSRPNSGLSNTSTIRGHDLLYSDTRAASTLSMLSSILRPQSAPTPRIDNSLVPVDGANSPAGPAGVYYNSAFITDNNANNTTLNDSDTYRSPAVLRSKSRCSPGPLPLETSGNNTMDTSLQSSERSVHFASPVHSTKYIEHGKHTETGGTSGGERVYQISILDEDIPKELQPYFVKLSAVAKGYLTRRLLKTEKVQGLIKTIRDTAEFAIKFQQESPIKRGIYSNQDKKLQDQVINQLTAVMYEIHEVFFELSVSERMSIIATDRELVRERIFKQQNFQEGKKRLSTATLKAMDRKKKLQAAEEIVFGQQRPKSAPPPTSNRKTPRMQRTEDISGPLRRHYQFLFNRALKPLHGNTSPQKPGDKTSSRDVNKAQIPKRTNNNQNKVQPNKPIRTKSPAVTSTAVKRISQSKQPVRKIARPVTMTTTKPENQKFEGGATYSGSSNNKMTRVTSRTVSTVKSS